MAVTVSALTMMIPVSTGSQNSTEAFNNLEGASTNSLSSSWYCFDFNGIYSQNIQTDLLLSSFNNHVVSGNYEFYFASGNSQVTGFTLGAKSFNVTNVNSLVKNPVVAVAVNVNGGGVAVEMQVQSANFVKYVGCSPAVSSFAISSGGATGLGNNCDTVILNPTSQPAVVDIQVFTTSGVQYPTQLQGLVVPANGIGIEDLSQLVPNQSIEFLRVYTPSGASDITMSTISYTAGNVLYEPGFYENFNRVTFAAATNVGNQVLTLINPTQKSVHVTINPILQGLNSVRVGETVSAGSALNISLPQLTQIPAGTNYGLRLDLKSSIFAWIYCPGPGVLDYPYPDLASNYAIPILENNYIAGQILLDSADNASVNFKAHLLFPFRAPLPASRATHLNGTLMSAPPIMQVFSSSGDSSLVNFETPLALTVATKKGVIPDLIVPGASGMQLLPVQVSS